MALITLDQILLPLRYDSGSGVLELAANSFKTASFTELRISGSVVSSGSVYIVQSGSLEGNPVDGGTFD
jgi:hypothetical protein